MAAPAHIARENGKKGGRPKGILGKSTLEAIAAKEKLVAMYMENIVPITEALIAKAKEGDVAAIKELHDRVYGRPLQAISGPNEGPIQVTGVEVVVRK